MKKKRQAFSLIEILIAFVLAGILFGCIFSNLFQSAKLQGQMETTHSIAINRQQAELKLRSLFSELPISLDENDEEETTPPLYTADYHAARSSALWLSLTVDCASDRRFAGPLTYCLYHDEKLQALRLLVRNELGEEKSEEIMQGVNRCKILLFDADKAAWTVSWSKKRKSLPTMLKLQIIEKDRKEELEFAFPLPASQQTIVFTP